MLHRYEICLTNFVWTCKMQNIPFCELRVKNGITGKLKTKIFVQKSYEKKNKMNIEYRVSSSEKIDLTLKIGCRIVTKKLIVPKN